MLAQLCHWTARRSQPYWGSAMENVWRKPLHFKKCQMFQIVCLFLFFLILTQVYGVYYFGSRVIGSYLSPVEHSISYLCVVWFVWKSTTYGLSPKIITSSGCSLPACLNSGLNQHHADSWVNSMRDEVIFITPHVSDLSLAFSRVLT